MKKLLKTRNARLLKVFSIGISFCFLMLLAVPLIPKSAAADDFVCMGTLESDGSVTWSADPVNSAYTYDWSNSDVDKDGNRLSVGSTIYNAMYDPGTVSATVIVTDSSNNEVGSASCNIAVPTPTGGNPPAPTGGNPPTPTGGNPPAPTGGNPPTPTGGNPGFLINPLNPIFSNNVCTFLNAVINIVTEIGAVIGVLLLVWCGFLFVKAQGKPAELDAAKSTLKYTVIGIVILLGASVFAKIIITTVMNVLGSSSKIC